MKKSITFFTCYLDKTSLSFFANTEPSETIFYQVKGKHNFGQWKKKENIMKGKNIELYGISETIFFERMVHSKDL